MEDPQNKDGKLITVPGICYSAFLKENTLYVNVVQQVLFWFYSAVVYLYIKPGFCY